MKKLIFILIFNISLLLAVENENSEYQFTLYPEFVGLGAMPSISLEYNFNNQQLELIRTHDHDSSTNFSSVFVCIFFS